MMKRLRKKSIFAFVAILIAILLYVSYAIYINSTLIYGIKNKPYIVELREVEKYNLKDDVVTKCKIKNNNLTKIIKFERIIISTPDFYDKNLSKKQVNETIYKVVDFSNNGRLFIKTSDFGFENTLALSNIKEDLIESDIELFKQVSELTKNEYFEYLFKLKISDLSLFDDYFNTVFKVLLLNEKHYILPKNIKNVVYIKRSDEFYGYIIEGKLRNNEHVLNVILFNDVDDAVYEIKASNIDLKLMECMLLN